LVGQREFLLEEFLTLKYTTEHSRQQKSHKTSMPLEVDLESK